MKNRLKDYWKNSPLTARVVFWILLVLGVGFIIASWFVPPMGVIDSSVLAAFGEILGFSSIGVGLDLIYQGREVKLRKGDTEIEINNKE